MQQDESRLSHESSEEQANQPQDSRYQATTFIPLDFNKAKRNVIKLVEEYFKKLKQELKYGAKLFVNRNKLTYIEEAIIDYVGLRYNGKGIRLEMKLADEYKKEKGSIWSYFSESDKVVSYNHIGKMSVTAIEKGDYKMPDVATPVGFEKSVYLIDPCSYDLKRKVFVPSPPALCVNWQGKLRAIAEPIFFRSKCAVVRKKEYVYLLGGEATDKKILTNRCERYNLKSQQSEEIHPMRHKHVCPSACFLGEQLWVFSQNHLQLSQSGKQWIDIGLPFGARFLPFQFVVPINDQQILIFGGSLNNQKSRQVKIYNTKRNYLNHYGRLLPQGMSHERNSAPTVIQGCMAAITSVQASVYPQVGFKSNISEVVYIFQGSAYLNSVIVI